MQFETMGVKGD